ncbi:MAG: hypothetical protein KGJ34_00630 [Patescibacteria group bacterium]|nr:hypothetical protein [Patescibacteria group bacterium]
MSLSSFNIIYILANFFGFFSNVGNGATIQSGTLTAIQNIELAALAVSVVLLILLIYLRLALEGAEHRVHHQRLHAELEMKEHAETRPGNPRWHDILALFDSPLEGDWRRAIIDADSMLASMLTEKGFVGADIGEQLRGASVAHFGTRELAWQAHHVRNRIAHDGEQYHLTEHEARATADLYRRVFEEFKYI